ncbi:MAG: threonine synthase [Bacteroidia bacterium]|nr:threonine synthase [Bacteroidia bacterium]
MNFYSTNDASHQVGLAEAVLRGLPADNGLYMPETLEALPSSFWRGAKDMPFPELALAMTRQLIKGSVPDPELREIVERACVFDAPLVQVGDRYVLELFHGPTLAFKDFGACFMAQLMGWLIRGNDQKLRILVATSGDTGGAVAAGFFGVPGIEVTILYPEGKVSPLQERQLTTWGGNIRAIAINGVFDDCQALVKQAFLDEQLRTSLQLSSANSINIARLIPQSWYYARAWQQLPEHSAAPVFCVPSGNFGNITGGVFAQRLGLPVHRFLAATNTNDVVPEFLRTGSYRARPSVATLSNAMDVGNPSNVARLHNLLGPSADAWDRILTGDSVSDDDTLATMQLVWKQHDYCLDPHGAVGWHSMDQHRDLWDGYAGILLETAHPAKFAEVVEQALKQPAPTAESLESLKGLEVHKINMDPDFETFKAFLLDNR